MRKNKRKEKSIVVSQNLIHLVVPPTFLSGSTPMHVASGNGQPVR